MINEIKQELVAEYRITEIENRLEIVEKNLDNLIASLKIKFYNGNQSEYKDD